MATRKALPIPGPEACRFWQRAFEKGCDLVKEHDGRQLAPAGAAHYAADFADRAVEEFQRRWGDHR